MRRKILYSSLLVMIVSVMFVCAPITEMAAQCPMCKMSAESNLKNGGSAGKGLNAGILYMLATPYLLIGGLGFVWLRNRKKNYDN